MLRDSVKAELTFSQIVIAVLSLTVLVVSIMIFSGQMSVVDDDLNSCASKGGTCNETCAEGAFDKPGEFSDCSSDESCCIKVLD